jgi:protein-S-isoprenylcysteine O-methyltransferase Ste14
MEHRLHDRQVRPEAAQVLLTQTRERVARRSTDTSSTWADQQGRAATLLLRLPPPLVYVAAFLLGVGLQRLMPVLFAPRLETLLQGIGALVLTLGILLGPVNALMFLLRGTTLNPAQPPNRLFTGGIYRLTRNPMYIGLLLVYAGLALLHAQAWALLLIVVPTVVVDRIYIPFEEQQLTSTFGAAYLSYCKRVRRWLGVGNTTNYVAPSGHEPDSGRREH